MNTPDNSLLELLELNNKKAPEYFDLMSATTEAEFNEAFEIFLERAVSELETNKKLYATLGEDGLSSVLAAALSIPGLSVTRETNSNGHVDITVTADHCSPMRKNGPNT